MVYILDGHFINGEKWQEVCHNIKEVKYDLKKVDKNMSAWLDKISSRSGEDITDKIVKKIYGDIDKM